MPATEDYDEAAEELIQLKQNALVALLSRAKPLTGRGYFNVDRPMIISIMGAAITYIIVLLQFTLSEKTTELKSNASLDITNVVTI